MPELNTILLVMAAGFALSASPGPSMLYVLSRTTGQNRAAGLASSMGLALGGILLALATAVGLTAAFTYSEPLYHTVQYLGAAYLAYLGVQMLLASTDQGRPDRVRRQSFQKIVVQGIFVELLNPKTVLFFIAFIPQFIDTELGNISLQMLVLGILVPLTALPSDIIVAFAGGTLSARLSEKKHLARTLNWLAGLCLIGLGIKTLLL